MYTEVQLFKTSTTRGLHTWAPRACDRGRVSWAHPRMEQKCGRIRERSNPQHHAAKKPRSNTRHAQCKVPSVLYASTVASSPNASHMFSQQPSVPTQAAVKQRDQRGSTVLSPLLCINMLMTLRCYYNLYLSIPSFIAS